jgi:beta-ureidopropionase
MKIALIQQHATKNTEENVARGLKALETAASQGAEVVAYAELAFDFFLPQTPAHAELLARAEPVPGPTTELFSNKAKELGVVVILNLYESDGEKRYDTSPVIDRDGSIAGKTRMVHIIEAPCFHEKGYYTPGDLGSGVFDTAAGRIGIAICYDRHYPEYMRSLALKGADVVFIPQAGAIDEWPPGVFEAEMQIAAFQNGYFTALVNRVGKEEHMTFAGESFVADPEGRVIARAPKNQDYILICDLPLEMLRQCPARKHFIEDRRAGITENL